MFPGTATTKHQGYAHLFLIDLLLSLLLLHLARALAMESMRQVPEGLLGAHISPKLIHIVQLHFWFVAIFVFEL